MWRTAASLFYLLLPCLGLGIYGQDSLSPLLGECVAETGHASPYVRAFREQRPLLRGCESQDNYAVPGKYVREVHVLTIQRPVAAVDGGPPHVTLRLEPTSSAIHRGQLVFILVAPNPVVWKVEVQRISNQSRVIFVIQNGARVVKSSQLRHKLKREHLPSRAEDLTGWARRKYRTLTSLVETPHANIYLKKVGTIPGASPRCQLTSPFDSPYSVVKYLEPQTARACSVSRRALPKAKNIHVIELQEANSSASPGVATVDLAVSVRSRAARSRPLLLLLKGGRPLLWRIHAENLRGEMRIITSLQNEMNAEHVNDRLVVHVIVEPQLNDYKGESLRRWVLENCGPLVSYTDVPIASHINLIVDGAEPVPKVSPTAGHDPKASRAQDDQHMPTSAIDDEVAGGGGGGGRPPAIGGSAAALGGGRAPAEAAATMPLVTRSPFLTPSKTRAVLNQAKHVRCTTRDIRVILAKSLLRLYGIRREHLSLLAPECIAGANRTHFILHTTFNSCGTNQTIHGGERVTYRNAIMLRDVELTDATEELGSADLSEMRSLLAADHTRIDDEDYAADPVAEIRVDFQCDYAIGPIGPRPEEGIEPEEMFPIGTGQPSQPGNDHRFKLEVYEDERYSTVITKWPLSVTLDKRIFIQAEVSNTVDENLSIVLRNCWIGATQFPNPTGHYLIEKGCRVTSDVRLSLPQGGVYGRYARFSFPYPARFLTSRAFVGCRLGLCAQRIAHVTDEVPLCTPRNCSYGRVVADDDEVAGTNVKFTGELYPPKAPFWSRDKTSSGENRTPQDGGQPSASSPQCQEVIHVEGLDSGTVVGISFAAFIIGVLLTAALWVIHTHTGPYRAANRPRSNETSGESTPSSTAPITIHHIHT